MQKRRKRMWFSGFFRGSGGVLLAALLCFGTTFADGEGQGLTETPESTTADIVAETEPVPEEKQIPFGSSVGYDDAWRAMRERSAAGLNGAYAEAIYVADLQDVSYAYYSRRPNTPYRPASTAKIMTCLLILENCDLDAIAIAPSAATSLGGTNSLMGLLPDEPMEVRHLLYGLMLRSGNDAAITLAVYMSGTEEKFAEEMNRRAAEIGMENTCFTNAAGKNTGENRSTAYDMTLLAAEAMQNATFREIVATVDYTAPANSVRKKPLEMHNGNDLVGSRPGRSTYYEYAVGIKPGATALGHTLIAAATKKGVTLICSQLGMEKESFSNETRSTMLCENAKMFFEYVYTYEYADVAADALIRDYSTTIRVENARTTDPEQGELTVHAEFGPETVFRPIHEIDALYAGSAAFDVTVECNAEAPIQKGDPVGTVSFSYNGQVWFTAPLLADRGVEEFREEDLITPSPIPTATPTVAPTAVPTTTPATPQEPEETSNENFQIETVVAWSVAGVAVVTIAALVWCKRKKR